MSDPVRLGGLVAEAGFTEVETGTEPVIFETESLESFTEFIRDVAPQLTTMLAGHPADVQEHVWGRITDAYGAFQGPDGRVRTENKAIWVSGIR